MVAGELGLPEVLRQPIGVLRRSLLLRHILLIVDEYFVRHLFLSSLICGPYLFAHGIFLSKTDTPNVSLMNVK